MKITNLLRNLAVFSFSLARRRKKHKTKEPVKVEIFAPLNNNPTRLYVQKYYLDGFSACATPTRARENENMATPNHSFEPPAEQKFLQLKGTVFMLNQETLDKLFENFRRHVEVEKQVLRNNRLLNRNGYTPLMISFGDRVVELANRYIVYAIEQEWTKYVPDDTIKSWGRKKKENQFAQNVGREKISTKRDLRLQKAKDGFVGHANTNTHLSQKNGHTPKKKNCKP